WSRLLSGRRPPAMQSPRAAGLCGAREPPLVTWRVESLDLSNALASMRLVPWRPLPLPVFASKHHPLQPNPQLPARPSLGGSPFAPPPQVPRRGHGLGDRTARPTGARTPRVNASRTQRVRLLWLNRGTSVGFSLRRGNTR